MVCTTLRALYGRDTRAAQWLNITVSAIWVLVLWLETLEVVHFVLPLHLANSPSFVVCLSTLAIASTAMALMYKGRPRQLLKSFGLVLGALAQAVIANGYVSAYPPLDMMLVVSTALSLWFFGAVFYILKCEGVDGAYARKR